MRHGVRFTRENTMEYSTSDIITGLPCDVLENILGCLTVQEAVRTSILSRKWRYIWTRNHKIVFDDHSCTGWAMRETRDKIMLLHHGPIVKFELSLTTLNTFEHLKHIVLYGICFGHPDEMLFLLFLLRSSPKLEKIEIYAFHGASAAATESVQGWSNVSLNDLSIVEMHCVSGTKHEMEFIKLMLSKSPMLKEMKIKLKSEDIAEELRILKELTGFRRASNHVVIDY